MQLAALQLDQRLVSLAPKAELHDGGTAAAALELHAVDRGVEAREELLDLRRAHAGDEPAHAEPRLLLLTRPLLLLAGAVGGRPEPRVDGAHVAAGRVDAAAHVRVARGARDWESRWRALESESYNKTPSHDTRHGTGAHWH